MVCIDHTLDSLDIVPSDGRMVVWLLFCWGLVFWWGSPCWDLVRWALLWSWVWWVLVSQVVAVWLLFFLVAVVVLVVLVVGVVGLGVVVLAVLVLHGVVSLGFLGSSQSLSLL